jgi:glycosyltransferase involved in cell wall biosynthesis
MAKMKILQANKYFYLRGGSERYFFDLCRLLRERGHEIIHFSMAHPRNEVSDQARYFVSEIDLNAPMPPHRRLEAALRILYSNEAKRKFGRLLDDSKPDLVHFHNITRQLSPSIVDAAAKRGIPMIQTMHDLSLICPAHSFFFRGRACEACAGGKYWHAAAKRCIDGSLTSSALGAFEAYLHDWLGAYKKIGLFVAPSLFLKSKVSSLRWITQRIVHLPYFVPTGPDYSSVNEGFVLFAGRISIEKGVGTVLEAAGRLREVRFVVAGEGDLLESFKVFARAKRLDNVKFTGYVKGPDLETLLRGASCVVVPSISYENLPLSILEAFARGLPVVASDCGGNPELVKDGITGYLFEPGNVESLAASLSMILGDEGARLTMGRQARELVRSQYSPDVHYEKLMDIYEKLRT